MCSLCDQKTDEITHLDLYVSGSEGCWVCLSCRMILTEVARGIRSTSSRVKLDTLKSTKVRND